MLGWMLKRGVSAPEPAADGDTTLADQPDTPAPVFAARAFKSALFGVPAAAPSTKALVSSNHSKDVKDTPSKPQGILLTPGTGTTRRKRVSFGHDIGAQANGPELGQRGVEGAGRNRKRTRLTTALENASRKSNVAQNSTKGSESRSQDDSDSEWEEEDDGHDPHDVTVDLAEPHSESGKYWKQEFHKYREDAKVEMDKMLKYKRLAKSYAKLKDAEAMELAEKLRDEQQKVIAMEKKISESASTIVSQHKRPLSEKSVTETVAKLTKQTALAVQYRQRVQELEDQLDELVRKKEEGETNSVAGRQSEQAIADLQRELRRASDQARENEELREQISDLKGQLKEAQDASGEASSDSVRTRELRAQLRDAKEQSRKKDTELRKLRREHEALQAAYESQVQEMRDLLSQSQSRYADLKKEMAALQADRPSQMARPRSWHPPAAANAEDAGVVVDGETLDLFGLQSPPKTRATSSSRQQTLRDKFRKDAATVDGIPRPNTASATLSKEMTLEPVTRPPHVRRSPRNKAYDTIEPSDNVLGNTASTRTRPKSVVAPSLPEVKHTQAALAGIDKGDEGVDLLKTQFARLGGPEMAGNNSTVLGNTTAKSTLPPERRAAALARLERKRVERQRTKTRPGIDKENMRPVGA